MFAASSRAGIRIETFGTAPGAGRRGVRNTARFTSVTPA